MGSTRVIFMRNVPFDCRVQTWFQRRYDNRHSRALLTVLGVSILLA